MTNNNIGDQVVLVTAGAAGIGRCIAECFLQQNFRVHICDIDTTAIETFLAANPLATASVTDVSEPQQVDALFADVTRLYGRLDVLINNAGIAGPVANLEHISPADWQYTLAVDLHSTFYCSRLAIPLLRKQSGGSIINLASNAGLFGVPMRSPYAASKWAIIGLTKTLAMELGVDHIRVNAICPGSVGGARIDRVIENDAAARGIDPDTVRDVYQRQNSLRVFIEPEDVANMAMFLASAAGRHISGQTLTIDGHTETTANWLDT